MVQRLKNIQYVLTSFQKCHLKNYNENCKKVSGEHFQCILYQKKRNATVEMQTIEIICFRRVRFVKTVGIFYI